MEKSHITMTTHIISKDTDPVSGTSTSFPEKMTIAVTVNELD